MEKQNKKKKDDLTIDIKELIQNVKGKVHPMLIEGLLENIKDNLHWKLNEAAAEEINVFLKEEIQPEIKKKLLANKQALLDGIEGAMKNLGIELGKKIKELTVERVTKLESYHMRKIMEEIF